MVRAAAPLGACAAEVDPKHRKWLHVRVRSPYSCLAAVANDAADETAARRRLRRGHWTLAFADPESCARAKEMLDARGERLRDACRRATAPALPAVGGADGEREGSPPS